MTDPTIGSRELDFLFQLSRTLAHHLPPHRMIATIVGQLALAMGIDEATAVLTDTESGPLIIGTKRRHMTSLQREILRFLHTVRQPLAVTDTSAPRRSGDLPLRSKEVPPRALLVLPLSVRDQSLGALFLYKKKPEPFLYSQFIFYNEVASRLADYIENQRLITQISQKEQQLAAIIEHSGEGIAALDENERIIVWNAALERLTGIASEEVIGQPCATVHALLAADPCPFEAEGPVGEYLIRPRDQRLRRYLSVISSPVAVAAGKTHRVFLFRDISRAKELEEAKSDFISLATHQLRTPLTAILGYLSMLSSPSIGPLTADQQRYLIHMRQAAERLSALVEDLLHVIRLEEGRVAFTAEPVGVRAIVKDIVAELSSAVQHKSLRLIVQDDDDMTILADAKWVRHILTNLIDNAIKYTPPGGTITVSWEAGRHEDRPVGIVRVQDTGIGIARSEQELIFQKFGRLQGHPINVSGSGLGLYIAKQLTEKQGGTISVKSARGKGSTFTLAFPLAVARTRASRRPPTEKVRKR